MTEGTQSATQSVQAISAKLALFYEHNPDGWFINIEAQFEIARISNEKTKFYHTATALSASASEEIQYFLQPECASNYEIPNSNLKKERLRARTVDAKLQR